MIGKLIFISKALFIYRIEIMNMKSNIINKLFVIFLMGAVAVSCTKNSVEKDLKKFAKKNFPGEVKFVEIGAIDSIYCPVDDSLRLFGEATDAQRKIDSLYNLIEFGDISLPEKKAARKQMNEFALINIKAQQQMDSLKQFAKVNRKAVRASYADKNGMSIAKTAYFVYSEKKNKIEYMLDENTVKSYNLTRKNKP